MQAGTRSWRVLFAAIVVAAAALFLFRLGAIGLWAPDEPRYAQIAEELRSMEHGLPGLVLLHLNGEAYTQKPPLYYWLAAALGAIQGRVTETAARLPSALSGVACVALTVALGRMLFGAGRGAAGLWAGAILLTVFRFAHMARRAQLDVLLTALELVAFVAFWRIHSGRGRRGVNLTLLYGGLGLAVLTKGPVGLLPLVAIVAYLAWERRLGDLRPTVPGWGLALAVVPALVWIGVAVALAPSGFFGDAVLDNVIGRFFSGTSHVRPVYYFAYQLPLDFLPWTLLWPLAGIAAWAHLHRTGASPEAREAARPWRFLLAWTLSMVVFFSISAGKRGLYLLPAFPALALMIGASLEELLAARTRLPTGVLLAIWGVAAGVAGACILVAVSGGVEVAPGFTVTRSFAAIVACLVAAAMIASVALRTRAGPAAQIVVVICAVFAIELAAFSVLFPSFDNEKSPRRIALAAAELTPPGNEIGVFEQRALTGGIEYYAHRRARDLSNDAAARAFAEERGGPIVLPAAKLGRLREIIGPLVVASRSRSGRRELLVVVPEDPVRKRRETGRGVRGP